MEMENGHVGIGADDIATPTSGKDQAVMAMLKFGYVHFEHVVHPVRPVHLLADDLERLVGGWWELGQRFEHPALKTLFWGVSIYVSLKEIKGVVRLKGGTNAVAGGKRFVEEVDSGKDEAVERI